MRRDGRGPSRRPRGRPRRTPRRARGRPTATRPRSCSTCRIAVPALPGRYGRADGTTRPSADGRNRNAYSPASAPAVLRRSHPNPTPSTAVTVRNSADPTTSRASVGPTAGTGAPAVASSAAAPSTATSTAPSAARNTTTPTTPALAPTRGSRRGTAVERRRDGARGVLAGHGDHARARRPGAAPHSSRRARRPSGSAPPSGGQGADGDPEGRHHADPDDAHHDAQRAATPRNAGSVT